MRTQKVLTQIWTLSLMLFLSLAVCGASVFNDANWASLGGIPGVDGQVEAAVVDSSGNLYIAGEFQAAGAVIAHYIAKWDGTINPPVQSRTQSRPIGMQFKTNLLSSPWITFATNTAGGNGRGTVQDRTATNAQRFYRLQTP